MSAEMFPRAPRRMKQPRKAVLRDQLAQAATALAQKDAENAHLKAVIDHYRRPWWRRLLRRSS